MLDRVGPYTLAKPLDDTTPRAAREARRTDGEATGPVRLDLVRLPDEEDPRELDLFLEDAASASRLPVDGPAMRPLDHGVADGFAWVAHEDAPTVSLAEVMAQHEGPLPPEWAALIARDVAEALEAAHAMRPALVHRALSPDAIAIDREGRARVHGFATASLERRLTIEASRVGTEAIYFSPEMALERPITEKTDLFSLGATLYHAVTGQPPFDGPTPLATLIKVRLVSYDPVPDVAPDVPEALVKILDALLAASPSERPGARDLHHALRPLVPAREEKERRAALGAFAPQPPAPPPSTELPSDTVDTHDLLSLALPTGGGLDERDAQTDQERFPSFDDEADGITEIDRETPAPDPIAAEPTVVSGAAHVTLPMALADGGAENAPKTNPLIRAPELDWEAERTDESFIDVPSPLAHTPNTTQPLERAPLDQAPPPRPSRASGPQLTTIHFVLLGAAALGLLAFTAILTAWLTS